MKTYVLILCFSLLATLSCAQPPRIWIRHSPAECVALVDSLQQGMKRQYQQDSLRFPERSRGSSMGRDVYYLIEKGVVQKPKLLAVSFTFYMDGEDKSLEIEGTPTYKVRVIQGPYLDLFPIWQRQFKPDADLQNIAQEGADKALIEEGDILFERFIFEKTTTDGSEWRIFR